MGDILFAAGAAHGSGDPLASIAYDALSERMKAHLRA
jgi:hypothetical protein